MADISQINLPDGSSVNIKDATARSDKMDKTNPTGTGTFNLKDGNGNTKVSLNSSTGDISCTSVNGVTPTEVAANPSGTGSADLIKIQIGNNIYNIPQGGSSVTVRFNINASHTVNPTQYDIVVSVGETEVYSHSYSCTIYGAFSETTDTFVYDNESYTITAQGYQANQGQKKLDVSINGTEESVYCSATNSSYPCDDDFFITVSEDLGGHTIVDSEGTSLEQRTNLQFNGAYSEDNSTDDTTEVNVVREMTKAEFDELTEDEKTGFINITDITGGNDDRFQPVIYSEDEREIGVWVDGKPLYQKTIVLQNVTVPTSSGYTYDITSLNVDAPIETPQGFIVFSSGADKRALPFNLLGNYGMTIAISRTSVVLSRASADITCDYVIFTIRYTKTTDTAGSGQWTPQGVPAHHYSTDEQIVGTWIDGSTVYEKTYTIADLDYSTSESYKELFTVPDADTIINISGRLINSANTYQYPIPYCSTNSKYATVFFEKIATHGNAKSFFFRSNDTWADGSLSVVVQYTKTST